MSAYFSRLYFSRYFYSIVNFKHPSRTKNLNGFYYFSDLYHQNSLTEKKQLIIKNGFSSFYQITTRTSPSRHFFFPTLFPAHGNYFDYSFFKFENLFGFSRKFFVVLFRFSLFKFVFNNKLLFVPFFYTIKK